MRKSHEPPGGAERASLPTDSVIFGFGPMVPFVIAAIGAWTLPPPWPMLAVWLAIIWGSLILAFVAGVRRGYGFGDPKASTSVAIRTVLVYFVTAGMSFLLAAAGMEAAALALLAVGFALVMFFDPSAARRGDAPLHFTRLRGVQMAITVISIVVLLVRVLRASPLYG